MNNASSQQGIHVETLDEVTVYGLNRIKFTTDAYLGLPTDILGTQYLVLAYGGIGSGGAVGSELLVVATADSTTITITPTFTLSAQMPAGKPYRVTLNQGQVYQVQEPTTADVSGTDISADKPIAVFGGHKCTFVLAAYCDHLVEQLPRCRPGARNLRTMPLATRHKGDTFRFLAARDGTTVSVNGTVVATLNRGAFHERIIDGPAHIVAYRNLFW